MSIIEPDKMIVRDPLINGFSYNELEIGKRLIIPRPLPNMMSTPLPVSVAT